MKTKSQFITIQPKTKEAKEFFNVSMKQLHSCKVLDKNGDNVFLSPISSNYKFWIDLKEDKNWEVIR